MERIFCTKFFFFANFWFWCQNLDCVRLEDQVQSENCRPRKNNPNTTCEKRLAGSLDLFANKKCIRLHRTNATFFLRCLFFYTCFRICEMACINLMTHSCRETGTKTTTVRKESNFRAVFLQRRGPYLCKNPGPMLRFLNILAEKVDKKSFYAQIYVLCKNCTTTLVVKNNANFFPPKGETSRTFVIIKVTP
jgi:hypothetical protein